MPDGPTMSLSPEEKRYYGQLFKTADSQRMGVITGDVAVKFFEKSGLSAGTLGQIWELSDKDNSGFLTQQSFSIALRLIGQAQNGRSPEISLAKTAGPLPRFDGIDIPSSTTSRGAAPQPPKARNVVPPLSPEDRAKYSQTWRSVSDGGEILSGDRARTIFEKANLPVEQLGEIWALSDRGEKGALDSTEFIVAMHLIQSLMNGSMKSIPTGLPPALFDAAAPGQSSARSQRQQSSVSSIQSDQHSGVRPTVPMRSQLTGPPQKASPVLQQQPSMTPGRAQQAIQPQLSGLPQTSEWDVKPHEKANYDTLFNDIDRSGKGYITGEEGADFFLQSKLTQDDLAEVWDLCTVWDNYSVELRRDWFAVAMHLIKGKLGGRDLPKTLPASLVPPSERAKYVAMIRSKAPASPPAFLAPAQPQSAAQSPPAPQHSSAAADLFGLNDSFSAPPPSQSPPAQAFMDNFGGIDRVASPTNAEFASQRGPPVNRNPPPSRALGGQPAFVPSSSFGQSIQQQQAAPVPQQQFQAPRQADHDLLGDSNPQETRNISADSTEVANLRNQMSSLTAQQEQSSQERARIDADLQKLKQEKESLTSRLQQIRQNYDQEVNTVRALQAEQGSLRAETRELLKEVSLLDASLGAVQQQHDQINAQLQKDRADNIAIKERIKSANEQTVTLKATLEKVQKDAKQQRGLVAINTKQLNTLEAGHEKLNSDIEEEQSRAAAEQAQYAEAQRIAAIEQERARANEEQKRSALISPALSTASVSTNPFHRSGTPGGAAPQRGLMSQTSGPAFPFVKQATAGAALAGVGTAAAAVAFGHQEGSETQSSQADSHRPAPVNVVEDDFSSSYNTAPTTAESFAPQSTLSGFEHAFSTSPQIPEEHTDDAPGSSQPPAFSELPGSQDVPRDITPALFQTNESKAPDFDNGLNLTRSNTTGSNMPEVLSPKPISQDWTDTDPFTADPRVASPTIQETSRKPLPAAVTNLAINTGTSDAGSISTSVQANASASVRETAAESRPSTPASLNFGSEPQSATRSVAPMESAHEEHELPRPLSPNDVQQTLTQAPQDEGFTMVDAPSPTLSPAVPGAFPSEESQVVPQEHQPASLGFDSTTTRSPTVDNGHADSPFAPFDAPVSANAHPNGPSASPNNLMDEPVAASAQEVDSSDDETVEEPRGANMFAQSYAPHASFTQSDDIETASTHTITREDVIPQASQVTQSATNDSGFGNLLPSRTSTITSSPPQQPSAPADDFDEFDDLEEATEVDEDDEAHSTYAHDTFEPTFDPPSTRSSYNAPSSSNLFSSSTQMAPPHSNGTHGSPARDFSEFSHYSSVIAEPQGLAPPIRDTDAFTSTNYYSQSQPAQRPSSQSQSQPQSQLQSQPPQFAFSPAPTQPSSSSNSAPPPPPPTSRYGASLAPKRPEPARAISAADDPMLIELMDMGFDRAKSVKALEDFNYDLGAATDYLLKGN